MKRIAKKRGGLLVGAALLLTACAAPIAEPTAAPGAPPTPAAAAAASQPAEEAPEVIATAVEPQTSLPAEPRRLEIPGRSGALLAGTYYPGNRNPGPTLVLFHWVMGDEMDWIEVAAWLQNRGMLGKTAHPQPLAPWHDPSWFPAYPQALPIDSWNVITVTSTNCSGGCPDWDPPQWKLDAEAVMDYLATLEGVDPELVFTSGASIGASQAAYACLYYNQPQGQTCPAAYPISPGPYQPDPFVETVAALGLAGANVWCGYAAEDPESSVTCQQPPESQYYRKVLYDWVEGATPWTGWDWLHGMTIFQPAAAPDGIRTLAEFLAFELAAALAEMP